MARRLPLPISGVAAVFAAAAVLLLPQAAATSTVAATESTQPAQPTFVYRVTGATASAEKLFAYGFDVLEERDGNDLFVLGSAAEGDRLRAAGFAASTETAMSPPSWAPPKPRSANNPTPARRTTAATTRSTPSTRTWTRSPSSTRTWPPPSPTASPG
jgi:carboxypeptidase T